jgi:Tautomerase enzyme
MQSQLRGVHARFWPRSSTIPVAGEQAKQRFYKTLVDLLRKDPGVRGEDVFAMFQLTAPANFSFASGVPAPEAVAAQARAGALTPSPLTV